MTVKIDGVEPNIFPHVHDLDARDAGRNVEMFLDVKIEGKHTPVTVKLSYEQASDLAILLEPFRKPPWVTRPFGTQRDDGSPSGGRQLHPFNQCRIVGFCLRQSPRRDGLPQEKILQHKLPFPPHKRTAAGTALYLAIIRLGPSLNFDHLIKRTAVRACEWIECSWPATWHDTSPIHCSYLLLGRVCSCAASRNCRANVTLDNHTLLARKRF